MVEERHIGIEEYPLMGEQTDSDGATVYVFEVARFDEDRGGGLRRQGLRMNSATVDKWGFITQRRQIETGFIYPIAALDPSASTPLELEITSFRTDPVDVELLHNTLVVLLPPLEKGGRQ